METKILLGADKLNKERKSQELKKRNKLKKRNSHHRAATARAPCVGASLQNTIALDCLF
jgi:hypothetical protein